MTQVVAGRACGTCTACCKELVIDEPGFTKDADVWCPHRIENTGCGLYPRWPKICQDWYCLWRLNAEFPASLRPDRCGVLFHLTTEHLPERFTGKIAVSAKAIDVADAFMSPGIAQILAAYFNAGVPVFVNCRDQSILLNDAIAEHTINDPDALAVALTELFRSQSP